LTSQEQGVLSTTSPHNIKFGLLNARSVKNKAGEISEYVLDNSLDIIALTETWLGPMGSDGFTEQELCPPGYTLLLTSRSQGRGGGVAFLWKSIIYSCDYFKC
jgi:hypothetical protein